MGALLIAAAVDLDDGTWSSELDGEIRDKMTNSLALGQGGPVGSTMVPGGLLFSRPYLRDAPPARLGGRKKPWIAHQGASGARVLFAGELHDRDTLIASLPSPLAGTGDDALYAAALAHYGDDCDRHLTGHYAAIAWFPEQQRLRLARSPISAPPLHIWQDGPRVVASSTPRAAIAAGADEAIDEARLADALYLNFFDPYRGWYRDISRVGTGEYVSITRDGLERTRYWNVKDLPELRLPSDQDYVDAVEDAMRRALVQTLRPYSRPAIQLSGGLDSQAVASFALETLPQGRPLKAYSWVPQEGFTALSWPSAHGDEREHAKALAALHPQLDLELVDTGDLPLNHREETFFLLSGLAPMGGGNMHWGHEMLQRASASGHDVMLDGGFGNSGFSYDGLTGPATWVSQGRFLRAWKETRLLRGKRPAWRRFISNAVMPHLPAALRRKLRKARKIGLDPFDSWCPLNAEYARAHGVIARSLAAGHDPDFLELRSARDWRAAVSKMGAGDGADSRLALELLYGIALRSPLAYRPLFELTASIPDEQYLRDGETRWLARRLLKGRVPEQVRTERRLGIQSSDWPVRWRRERDALLAELDQFADDPQMARMLDIPRLRKWLGEWSGEDSVGGLEAARIFCAVGRGLTAARFVRFRERGNG